MYSAELHELMVDIHRAGSLRTKGATKNYRRIEDLFKPVLRTIGSATRIGWRGRAPTDADAKALARDSKALSAALDITAENETLARLLKKKLGKVRNLRKMLSQYAKVGTGEELRAVLNSQTTKSKDAWDKLRDYSEFVMMVIGGLDAEVEQSFSVGGYRVTLVTALRSEWSGDLVAKLRQALVDTDRRLARIGMSSVSGGVIYAYPRGLLPPGASLSHNVYASYSPARDILNVAAASKKLVSNIIHELGHRAYFKLVEGRGRTAWSDFFESHSGAPDLDDILKRWESYAAGASSDTHRRYLGHYLNQASKEDSKWLMLVADNLDIEEKFNRYTGAPKGKGLPGLDQLLAKRPKAKVFLHPVTAYSGTNAEELFAETFSEYAVRGPKRVPPIVRIAFKKTIPGFRESAPASWADQLQEATAATTRVSWRHGGKAVAVRMRMGGRVVGHIQVMKDPGRLKNCQADIDALKARGHEADEYWFVTDVQVDGSHRGTGLGKRLYRTAFDAILKRQGSSIVGSHSCWIGSGTSPDAKRVWASLVREYPSSGSVIALSR